MPHPLHDFPAPMRAEHDRNASETCRDALTELILQGLLPSESRVEGWLDRIERRP